MKRNTRAINALLGQCNALLGQCNALLGQCTALLGQCIPCIPHSHSAPITWCTSLGQFWKIGQFPADHSWLHIFEHMLSTEYSSVHTNTQSTESLVFILIVSISWSAPSLPPFCSVVVYTTRTRSVLRHSEQGEIFSKQKNIFLLKFFFILCFFLVVYVYI